MVVLFRDDMIPPNFWGAASRNAQLSPQYLGFVWYLLSAWFGVIRECEIKMQFRNDVKHRSEYYLNVRDLFEKNWDDEDKDLKPYAPNKPWEEVMEDLAPFKEPGTD